MTNPWWLNHVKSVKSPMFNPHCWSIPSPFSRINCRWSQVDAAAEEALAAEAALAEEAAQAAAAFGVPWHRQGWKMRGLGYIYIYIFIYIYVYIYIYIDIPPLGEWDWLGYSFSALSYEMRMVWKSFDIIGRLGKNKRVLCPLGFEGIVLVTGIWLLYKLFIKYWHVSLNRTPTIYMDTSDMNIVYTIL